MSRYRDMVLVIAGLMAAAAVVGFAIAMIARAVMEGLGGG